MIKGLETQTCLESWVFSFITNTRDSKDGTGLNVSRAIFNFLFLLLLKITGTMATAANSHHCHHTNEERGVLGVPWPMGGRWHLCPKSVWGLCPGYVYLSFVALSAVCIGSVTKS